MQGVRAGNRRRSDRGAAAIELSLVLPLLSLLVFGTIQYGYYFFATQSASAAAREAARKVAVGDCADSDDLKAFVASRLAAVHVENLEVDRSYAPTHEIGNTLTVEVRFDTMDLNFPLLPVPGDARIVRSFDSRIENLDSGSC